MCRREGPRGLGESSWLGRGFGVGFLGGEHLGVLVAPVGLALDDSHENLTGPGVNLAANAHALDRCLPHPLPRCCAQHFSRLRMQLPYDPLTFPRGERDNEWGMRRLGVI